MNGLRNWLIALTTANIIIIILAIESGLSAVFIFLLVNISMAVSSGFLTILVSRGSDELEYPPDPTKLAETLLSSGKAALFLVSLGIIIMFWMMVIVGSLTELTQSSGVVVALALALGIPFWGLMPVSQVSNKEEILYAFLLSEIKQKDPELLAYITFRGIDETSEEDEESALDELQSPEEMVGIFIEKEFPELWKYFDKGRVSLNIGMLTKYLASDLIPTP